MSIAGEVKQKNDIVDIIGQYTKLTKAGRTFRGLCPFHTEKHPSFFVYPEQQSWHCFGACSTGGDVFSFVMKKENMAFGEALRFLAQRAGVTIPSRFEREDKREEKEELYQISEAAAQYFHNLLLNSEAAEKARKYVASRSFSPQTISDFQLGFSPNQWEALKQYLLERGYAENKILDAGLIIESEEGKTHDRFRNRLMFPIFDARGHVIGFGARALDDSMPKYLNSPQTQTFDKSTTIYGLNVAAKTIRQQELAVIVEGYIDVITAHQNGFSNVVASMGTAVTETQVRTLKKLSKNLILALDADAAGEEAMLRGVSYENILNAEIRVIIMPEGKDPDDVIKKDAATWEKLVATAIPIVDFTFDSVTTGLDMTTAKAQSFTVERLLPIVAAISDTIIRQPYYIKKLAHLTDSDEHTIEAAINRLTSSAIRPKKQETKEQVISRTLSQIKSDPLEEHCLALLLQHPELKAADQELPPEYFQNSENREIFTAWQQADDLSSLKEKLESALHEQLDYLVGKSLPSNQIEERYSDYLRSLRLRFLRNLEARKAEILALEVETGGAGADLAKLEEQGIETSTQIREIFQQKLRGGKAKEARK
ncbi:DNA primase [Chloroflexota bacterium]